MNASNGRRSPHAATVAPNASVTWSSLAVALHHDRQALAAGN